MDMAGAVGRAVAGPGWKATLALVSQETQTTGTTFERPLKSREVELRRKGELTRSPGLTLFYLWDIKLAV